jgi:hypothetical protein
MLFMPQCCTATAQVQQLHPQQQQLAADRHGGRNGTNLWCTYVVHETQQQQFSHVVNCQVL